MCHLVLLLPVFGLVVFWILPLPIAGAVYAVILVVTFFLYRAVMSAMHCPVRTGSEGMIGKTGQVIEGSGKVKSAIIHGEIWRVEADEALHVGETIRVTGMHGLSLSVHALGQKERRR